MAWFMLTFFKVLNQHFETRFALNFPEFSDRRSVANWFGCFLTERYLTMSSSFSVFTGGFSMKKFMPDGAQKPARQLLLSLLLTVAASYPATASMITWTLTDVNFKTTGLSDSYNAGNITGSFVYNTSSRKVESFNFSDYWLNSGSRMADREGCWNSDAVAHCDIRNATLDMPNDGSPSLLSLSDFHPNGAVFFSTTSLNLYFSNNLNDYVNGGSMNVLPGYSDEVWRAGSYFNNLSYGYDSRTVRSGRIVGVPTITNGDCWIDEQGLQVCTAIVPPTEVPEPQTLALVLAALVGAVWVRARRSV